MLEVLERINHELGTTVIVITHNASMASMADRGMVRTTAQLDPQLHAEEMRAWAKVATMFAASTETP